MSEQQPLVVPLQKHRSTIHISLMAWNTALSFFQCGYFLVYLGSLPIDTVLRIYHVDINKAVAQGVLNGCVAVGALIGSVASSFIIQRFSRKNNILLTNFIAFILGFLIYIPNFYTLVVFRVLQGICSGIFCALTPMAIRQFSPVSLSGLLGTFSQLNTCLGVLTSYFLTYVLKKITGDLTCQSFWFIIFGVPQVVMLVQSLLFIFVFPYDTPKYLLLKGDEAKAREVLKVIYKQEFVEEQLEQKKYDANHLKTVQNSQILTIVEDQTGISKETPKLAYLMAFHVSVTQQLTGVNAINVYCGPILEKATSAELAMFIPTLLIFVKFLSTVVTTFIIGRFGRKSLIQVGVLLEIFVLSMIAFGFFYKAYDESVSEVLIIVGLFAFIGVFGLTLGPLAWMYIPQAAEPKYVPFATALNWVCASSIIILFPIIKDNLLEGNPAIIFVFFTAYCIFALVICRLFLVETKNKTQGQIRDQYANAKFC